MTRNKVIPVFRSSDLLLKQPSPPAPNPYNDPTTGWHWIEKAKMGRRDMMNWMPAENETPDAETQ